MDQGALSRRISECLAQGDLAAASRYLTELLPLSGVSVGAQLQTSDHAAIGGLLPELDEVLGHDHVATLCACHLFAGRPQPDGQAAPTEWAQLLADERRVLGADHPCELQRRTAQT